ncbi:MAG: hypothetical protein DI629_02645 [Mesorhizobium amorphae]|nr:MAG: hypothetical protein DI629_02645 [Mesorhizobium amorphae]
MAKSAPLTNQVLLRLPDSLRDDIKKVAEDQGRSVNSEIIFRLTQWYNINVLLESQRNLARTFELKLHASEAKIETLNLIIGLFSKALNSGARGDTISNDDIMSSLQGLLDRSGLRREE